MGGGVGGEGEVGGEDGGAEGGCVVGGGEDGGVGGSGHGGFVCCLGSERCLERRLSSDGAREGETREGETRLLRLGWVEFWRFLEHLAHLRLGRGHVGPDLAPG